MRVLIAEDNVDDRKILKLSLEHNGCEVLEAVDGQEALELARERQPDLIVSDALMPRLDGFQLLRALRQDTALARVPFIFYSATYTGREEADLARSLGALAYIIKPKDPLEFWQELSAILAGCGLKAQPAVEQPLPEDHEYLVRYSNIVANKLEQAPDWKEDCAVEIFQPM